MLYKSILNRPQYLKLVITNLIGRFGDSLDAIAFTWIMYKITSNASMVAMIMAVNYIPTVLFQPFTGVFVDRFQKKYIMMFCDFGRAFMVFLTAYLFLTDNLVSWMLFPITFSVSTFEAFRMPAGSAIITKLLEPQEYKLGTAFNQTMCRIVEALGMVCAGVIIGFLGNTVALFIDAICFLISGIVIYFIPCDEKIQKSLFDLKTYFRSLADGFLYLKSNHSLIYLSFLGIIINFSFIPINVFQAPYIGDYLKMGAELLSLVSFVLMISMSVGAFLTPKLENYINSKKLITYSGIAISFSYMIIWIIPNFTVSTLKMALFAISYFLLGIGVGIQNVIFSSAIMTNVKSELLGRISGIFNSIMHLAMPVGSFICSVFAVFMPVPMIFLIIAVMLMIVFCFNPFIKDNGD